MTFLLWRFCSIVWKLGIVMHCILLIALAVGDVLCFYMNFMILFSCSVENAIEILMGNVAFDDTVSFTMLILPIHYPWESPHLPISSCVYKSFPCNVLSFL